MNTHRSLKPFTPRNPMIGKSSAMQLNNCHQRQAAPPCCSRDLTKLNLSCKGSPAAPWFFLSVTGTYSTYKGSKDPVLKAQALADKYNVCFNIIGTADTKDAENLLERIASVNQCSRVIPFETYISRPEYNSGALYVVKSGTVIETISDRKVVGLKTENILFDWDVSDINPTFNQELDQIGSFMQSHPQAFAVLDGYSDNTGSRDYNLKLSRRRADKVATYLSNKYGIGSERLVVNWYGQANPVAGNNTDAGRARNRRVEIAIGGMK